MCEMLSNMKSFITGFLFFVLIPCSSNLNAAGVFINDGGTNTPKIEGHNSKNMCPYLEDPCSDLVEVKARLDSESPISKQDVNVRTQMNGEFAQISYYEDFTASGARTYTVPIEILGSFPFKPEIALVYNSQEDDGVAGYGWDISGIPAISKSKNTYMYASPYKPYNTPLSLDGDALVDYNGPLSPEYEYCTVQGNCLVKSMFLDSSKYGKIHQYKVLYPNGNVGIFGLDDRPDPGYYPLVSLTDINGNMIEYSYGEYFNAFYISKIKFGTYNIEFEYNFFLPEEEGKYDASGNYQKRCALLHLINLNGDTWYSLKYEGNRFLKSIYYFNKGVSSNPLVFEYGESVYNDTEGVFTNGPEQNYSLPSKFGNKANYVTGHFFAGDPSEGVVLIPLYTNVARCLRVIPRINTFAADTTTINIPIDGQHMVKTIDVDGDGADEILVMVCYNKTVFVDVYKITPDAKRFEKVYRTYYRASKKRDKIHYVTLYSKAHHALLATISYCEAKPSKNEYSLAVLYDLTDREIIFEGDVEFNLFDSKGVDEACYYLSYDSDSDGSTEMFYVKENEIHKIGFISDENDNPILGSKRLANKSITGIPNPRENVKHFNFADMNGDGYMDIVVAPKKIHEYEGYQYDDSWSGPITIYYYNGKNAFEHTKKIEDEHVHADSFIFLDDIDKDGGCDVIVNKEDGVNYYLSKTGYRRQYAAAAIGRGDACIPVHSCVDSCNIRYYYLNFFERKIRSWGFTKDYSKDWKLVKLVDSRGFKKYNTYKNTADPKVYSLNYDRVYSFSDGVRRFEYPIDVLYRSETIMPTGGRSECRYYTYFDSAYSNWGLGFLCFGKIRIIDIISDRILTKEYLPEKFGAVGKEEIFHFKGTAVTKLSSVEYQYNTHDDDGGYKLYGPKINPQLIRSCQTNTGTGLKIIQEYEYGRFGLLTKHTIKKTVNNADYQTETQLYRYNNHFHAGVFDIDINTYTKPRYLLGVLTDVTTIFESDYDAQSSYVERKEITYDYSLDPIKEEYYKGKILPGGTHRVRNYSIPGEKLPDYLHEDPSNKKPVESDLFIFSPEFSSGTIEEVAVGIHESDGADRPSFEKWLNRDASDGAENKYVWDGSFLKQKTDSLGRITRYEDHDRYGNPKRIVSYLGTASYVRDNWGILLEEIDNNGNTTIYTYEWGGVGLFTVKEDKAYQPDVITHYDAFGRVVRKGIQNAKGKWIYQDFKYDVHGNLLEKSIPYSTGVPVKWDKYIYDEHDRILSIVEASGKKTSFTYSGPMVTKTSDGKTETNIKDAYGRIVDVFNTTSERIHYKYRDDGQPSEISSLGGPKVIMRYSLSGELTEMIDPSTGTTTNNIQYFIDGSIKETSTNPYGEIITYKDKAGRVTKIARPGEYDTIYSYDQNGNIVAEQSTNGTGKEYVYSDTGLILSIKETIPDGKWLKKTFNYQIADQLSSISYATEDGTITSLNYTYSYGNLYKTVNQNGVIINEVLEENDYGLPTKVMTGEVLREYGYKDGMPYYRKMAHGQLQNVRYEFDSKTGDLIRRADLNHDNEETFAYNNGCLSSMSGRLINYSTNGSITHIDGVGDIKYENTEHPYWITSFTPCAKIRVGDIPMDVRYTCYRRPARIERGTYSASFTYNGEGNRVKMEVFKGGSVDLMKYYIGDEYEQEVKYEKREIGRPGSGIKKYILMPGKTIERLFIGGDAYTAPMVYQKVDNGDWILYNIGRDYLGNINIIADEKGALIAEYSYDPWGRLRDPETLEIYEEGLEPELFLGRGYSGHEHLKQFSLINMNARLYDPLLGRFLSADPYVYESEALLGYNRYVYALNNPLRYTDPNGEFFVDFHIGEDGYRFAIGLYCFAISFGGDWAGNLNAYALLGFEVTKASFKATAGLKFGINYSVSTGKKSFFASAEASVKFGDKFTASLSALYSITDKSFTSSANVKLGLGKVSLNGKVGWSTKTKWDYDGTVAFDTTKEIKNTKSNTDSSTLAKESKGKTKWSFSTLNNLVSGIPKPKGETLKAVPSPVYYTHNVFFNDRVNRITPLNNRSIGGVIF